MTASHRSRLIGRFTLAGSMAGFCLGLLEAGILYFIPRASALQSTDVMWVIWFLAPLVDMLAFGLVALALGSIASLQKQTRSWGSAVLGAAGMGVSGAFLAELLDTFRFRVNVGFLSHPEIAIPVVWFGIVFACALLGLRTLWPLVGDFFDGACDWPIRSSVVSLLIVWLVLVSGLAVYRLTRAFPRHTAQAGSGQPQEPNIVLIVLDTTRADHLSSYGYSRLTTPHIDRLAAHGTLFENALAASSWTLPSFASMFTGLLPHQHGTSAYSALDTAPWTMAEVLKSYGYETAAFNANSYYGLKGWGLDHGFDVYDDNRLTLKHNLLGTFMGYSTLYPLYQHLVHYDDFSRRDGHEMNDEIFRWHRQRSNRPFFLMVNYFDAHAPYLAPAPYNGRFGQISENLLRQRDKQVDGQPTKPFTEEQRKALIAAYDECLASIDNQVGGLLQYLSSTRDWSNTIVIITADHGDAFGEHGTYDHGWNLYRELIHVPLIFYGPGIPAGQRIAGVVRTRELFATVVDLAAGQKSSFLAYSLRRSWTPEFQPHTRHNGVVSEVVAGGDERMAYVCLTTNEWHLILEANGRVELYQWPTDPEEQHDLARLPEYQLTLARLRHQMEEQVGHSLPPWRGLEYLSPLNKVGSYFSTVARSAIAAARNARRVGSAQALFAPRPSRPSNRPRPEDEDLMRTLPYQ